MLLKLGLVVLLLNEIFLIVSRLYAKKIKKIDFKKIDWNNLKDKQKDKFTGLLVAGVLILLFGLPNYLLSILVLLYGVVSLYVPAMILCVLTILSMLVPKKYKEYRLYWIVSVIDISVSIGLIIWWATLI